MNRFASIRLLCTLLAFASGQALAGPGVLSESLSQGQPATASVHESAPPAKTPLHLKLSSDVRSSIIRQLVLLKGQAMLGTQYVLGANSDDAVDCSSLIQQMYRNAGIELPRHSEDLAAVGRPVTFSALEPGDLLFYRWKKHRLHVAVYAGDGLQLHASSGKRKVVMSSLNKTWRRHMIAARRVIPPAQGEPEKLTLSAVQAPPLS